MEVMTGALDRAWWHSYRETLEREFKQHEILIRASDCRKALKAYASKERATAQTKIRPTAVQEDTGEFFAPR
jgi:hypothetical protein